MVRQALYVHRPILAATVLTRDGSAAGHLVNVTGGVPVCGPQGCGWGRRRAPLALSTAGIEGRSAQRTSEGAIFAMARSAPIAQIDP